jgi:hypothetical protein
MAHFHLLAVCRGDDLICRIADMAATNQDRRVRDTGKAAEMTGPGRTGASRNGRVN